MAVVTNQEHFRVRLDITAAQGGTPVWAAAQDVNYSIASGVIFRIRFVLANTGSTSQTATKSLFASRNGGAYAAVTTSTTFVRCIDATAGASADDAAITTQLLTGVGTFDTTGEYDDTGVTGSFAIPGGDCVEIEYGIVITSSAAIGDTYDFEIYPAGSPANTYTQIPRITVNAFTFGTSLLLSTATGDGGGDNGYLLTSGNTATPGGTALAVSGQIQSLSIYVTNAAGNVIIGLYDNTGTGGQAGSLKASTASTAIANGWNTFNVITPVNLATGTYWFAWVTNSNPTIFYNVGGTGFTMYVDGAQPFSMPATAPTLTANTGQDYAMYATLTAAVAAPALLNSPVFWFG